MEDEQNSPPPIRSYDATIKVKGKDMEWFNIKDKLPEIGERVLVYQKGGVFGGNEIDITFRTSGYYPDQEEINNRIAWYDQGMFNNIHFWMPLPSPPKE